MYRVTFPTLYPSSFGRDSGISWSIGLSILPATHGPIPHLFHLFPYLFILLALQHPVANLSILWKQVRPFLLHQLPRNTSGCLFVGGPPNPNSAPEKHCMGCCCSAASFLRATLGSVQVQGRHPAVIYRLSKIYSQIFTDSFQGGSLGSLPFAWDQRCL